MPENPPTPTRCPLCGADPDAPAGHEPGCPAFGDSPDVPTDPPRNRLSSGWIVAGALLLPLISLLVALWGDFDAAIMVISLILTPLLSLVAGMKLGVRLARSTSGKVLLGAGLSLLLLVGAESLLLAGCTWR